MFNHDYLAYLISIPEIGRKTILKIQNYIDSKSISLEEFINNGELLASSLLTDKQKISARDFQKKYSIQSYTDYLDSKNIRIITPNSEEYPELLQHIEDKPIVLFAKGATINQTKLPIAVVGSRKITPYGKDATEFLVGDLAGYNTTIISGCMYGVDMCAHQAAIKHRLPTIGVLGFGFNNVYPATYRKVFQELLHQGATLITEYAPDVMPVPGNFPVRNRIVAGMAQATVVIEASIGSGSLITAQCALDYNRAVGAIPGSFRSQYSEGTKWLINEGAKLVTTAEDIMAELYDQQDMPKKSKQIPNQIVWETPAEEQLYEQLERVKDIDELVSILGLPMMELQGLITSLELKQLVKRKGTFVERV